MNLHKIIFDIMRLCLLSYISVVFVYVSVAYIYFFSSRLNFCEEVPAFHLPNSYLFLLLSLFFMHFRILRFSFSLIRLLTFLSLNVLNLVAEHRGLSPRYQFLLLSPHYAIMTYAVLLRKLG